MGQMNPAGGWGRRALRWSLLASALLLVLSLVGQATRVEAIPVDPTSSDTVDGPPLVGHTFYGTVKNTQGVSLPNGTTVMAKAASGPWTASVTTKVGPPDANSGYYVVTVPADDPYTTPIEGAPNGTPIIFYAAGVKAKLYDVAESKWLDSYPALAGASTNLNLQADIYYTITASAGSGGTINPSGSVSVALGGSKTFTITASEGYAVLDVLVDSVSKGAITTYTFSNVTGNHTIVASFQRTTGDVAGFVFLDTNGNGTRDENETSGLAGVTITLLMSGGSPQLVVTTGPDGAYLFASVAPGQYTVQETQPLGYTSTSADSVAVTVTAANQSLANFGEQAWTPTPTATFTPTPTDTPEATPTVTVTPSPTTPVPGGTLYLPIVLR
jgi:hypothetical protein